jgi:hypothetical protein
MSKKIYIPIYTCYNIFYGAKCHSIRIGYFTNIEEVIKNTLDFVIYENLIVNHNKEDFKTWDELKTFVYNNVILDDDEEFIKWKIELDIIDCDIKDNKINNIVKN